MRPSRPWSWSTQQKPRVEAHLIPSAWYASLTSKVPPAKDRPRLSSWTRFQSKDGVDGNPSKFLYQLYVPTLETPDRSSLGSPLSLVLTIPCILIYILATWAWRPDVWKLSSTTLSQDSKQVFIRSKEAPPSYGTSVNILPRMCLGLNGVKRKTEGVLGTGRVPPKRGSLVFVDGETSWHTFLPFS